MEVVSELGNFWLQCKTKSGVSVRCLVPESIWCVFGACGAESVSSAQSMRLLRP
jgi:hypothetical protein